MHSTSFLQFHRLECNMLRRGYLNLISSFQTIMLQMNFSIEDMCVYTQGYTVISYICICMCVSYMYIHFVHTYIYIRLYTKDIVESLSASSTRIKDCNYLPYVCDTSVFYCLNHCYFWPLVLYLKIRITHTRQFHI